MARLLKEPACDVDHRDEFGHTPLHIAASVRSEAACCMLLDAGADKHIARRDGVSPLRIAAEKGHDAVARTLLDAGADKNPADHQSCTALFAASVQEY